ncbi:MAG: YHYH protein [Planctomycetota bacterium]
MLRCALFVPAAFTFVSVAGGHPPDASGSHDDSRPTDQPAAPSDTKVSKASPKNSVKIEVKDGVRTITCNGIPDHEPGKFPNRGNPNSISEQKYTFHVPEKPRAGVRGTPVRRDALVGVALNGVVFDPGTAEAWKDDPRSGWNIEAILPAGVKGRDLGLDSSHAHVQPNGAYHYHSSPVALVARLAKDKGVKAGDSMIQIGWAADGFPIYDAHAQTSAGDAKSAIKEMRSSYKLKAGERPAGDKGPGGKFDGTYTQDYQYTPGSGDLDEFNGRTGVTPEFPQGTYYYVVTGEFPYVPRQLKGTPDASFQKNDRPPGGGPGGGPGRRPGPGGPPGGPAGRPGGPGGPPPPPASEPR